MKRNKRKRNLSYTSFDITSLFSKPVIFSLHFFEDDASSRSLLPEISDIIKHASELVDGTLTSVEVLEYAREKNRNVL